MKNFDLDSVPSTVSESIKMFLSSLSDEERKTLCDIDENDISIFHHSWGQDLRNNWSLWEENTPLVNSFQKIGITHADDMSGIILVSAHRQLNKKPVKLTEQVNQYQEYWMKEIGKRMP